MTAGVKLETPGRRERLWLTSVSVRVRGEGVSGGGAAEQPDPSCHDVDQLSCCPGGFGAGGGLPPSRGQPPAASRGSRSDPPGLRGLRTWTCVLLSRRGPLTRGVNRRGTPHLGREQAGDPHPGREQAGAPPWGREQMRDPLIRGVNRWGPLIPGMNRRGPLIQGREQTGDPSSGA